MLKLNKKAIDAFMENNFPEKSCVTKELKSFLFEVLTGARFDKENFPKVVCQLCDKLSVCGWGKNKCPEVENLTDEVKNVKA